MRQTVRRFTQLTRYLKRVTPKIDGVVDHNAQCDLLLPMKLLYKKLKKTREESDNSKV